MSEPPETLFAWLAANLEAGSPGDYVTIDEIKSKFPGTAASRSIGSFIVKLFPAATAKRARTEEDWTKITQKYYGLHWKQTPDNLNYKFGDLPTLPADFFLLTKSESEIKLGHFTGEIVNGQKVMCEISLNHDQSWSLLIMDKIIHPVDINLPEKYTIHGVIPMVRQLRLCDGLDCDTCTISQDHAIQERVKFTWVENLIINRYRSKECKLFMKVTSAFDHQQLKVCRKCKAMPKHTKSDDVACTSGEKRDVGTTLTNNEAITTLNEEDHHDKSMMFESVFPNCTEKMKTFLLSQKVPLEKHLNGRRWDKNILQLWMRLWRRSPAGYIELRNSGFLVLPSVKALQNFKKKVDKERDIKKRDDQESEVLNCGLSTNEELAPGCGLLEQTAVSSSMMAASSDDGLIGCS